MHFVLKVFYIPKVSAEHTAVPTPCWESYFLINSNSFKKTLLTLAGFREFWNYGLFQPLANVAFAIG